MSGHSRWAGIKHKKGAADAKRGKIFTRIVRELTVAAKAGGGLPDNNPRLRKAMEDAKNANMPLDNVKKAIARGTGEIPGVSYEEVSYEGYGPGGVAVMVTGTTDNRNRTSSEIRKIFASHGGNMGESGCVAWMFSPRGLFLIEKSACNDEEKLMNVALEAGAEDIRSEDPEYYEVLTPPTAFEAVKAALTQAGVPLVEAEQTLWPQNTVPLKGTHAKQMLSLREDLEGNDDVNKMYDNSDIQEV